MSSRSTNLAHAFFDRPLTCGPLTLRPLTAGTMLLLMESGNALFRGAAAISEVDQMRAFFEFIWIHTAPEEQVIPATPEEIRAASRVLAMGITFDDLNAFAAQFSGLRERVSSAEVSIIPDKDTPPGKREPRHTGLPATSTPLEPMAIPSASSTASGAFPLSADSNISTPLTVLPAPSADGHPLPQDPETFPHPGEVLTPLP